MQRLGKTDAMTQQPSGRRWPASRVYSVIGALLGVGAPVGFFALRTLLIGKAMRQRWHEELRGQRIAYSYMAVATPIVFAIFGNVLGRRHERLRSAHAHIDQMHEDFYAIAAHDLRSPLTALNLQLEMWRSEARGGPVTVSAETLERASRTVERLSTMVSQLLDATRIESGRLRLDRVPISLPEAVASLLEHLRVVVADHPIELVVEGSPPPVMADTTRLDEIVTNLVTNAAKYSPDGTPIRVEVLPAPPGVMLRVRDQGYGIAADALPRLFERYFRANQARDRKSGLGLGLYITKGLVDAHGGTITVESEVGRGSTFSVWLPAAAPADRDPPHQLPYNSQK